MKKWILIILIFVFPASAEIPVLSKCHRVFCGVGADVRQLLQDVHKERVIGRSISGDGFLIEIFLSQTGTYSILQTNAQTGEGCLLSSGGNYEQYELEEPEGSHL